MNLLAATSAAHHWADALLPIRGSSCQRWPISGGGHTFSVVSHPGRHAPLRGVVVASSPRPSVSSLVLLPMWAVHLILVATIVQFARRGCSVEVVAVRIDMDLGSLHDSRQFRDSVAARNHRSSSHEPILSRSHAVFAEFALVPGGVPQQSDVTAEHLKPMFPILWITVFLYVGGFCGCGSQSVARRGRRAGRRSSASIVLLGAARRTGIHMWNRAGVKQQVQF